METTYLVLVAVLPIFLITGCGALARLFGWLDTNADLSLMKLVINLLYPALIFSNILGNDVLREPINLIIPPLFGLGTVLVGFAISWIVASKFKIGNSSERRMFSFITGIQNSTYFPLPIIYLLFGQETVGILLVFNLGVEVAIWLVGVGFILSSENLKTFFGRVVNAPVIAILLATWINYFRYDQELPDFVFKTIGVLGQCAIPLGLVLIGAIFADLKTSVKVFTRIEISVLAVVIRLAVLPLIFLLSAYFLSLTTELERVIVIQAAMPCAVFPIVLAKHFGGSSDIAFKIVLSTTLLSFLTIPFWIQAGIKLLGL
jgi:predicted permease